MGGQARYLEASALRLDPAQARAVAASITEGLRSPALDALASAEAEATFARLGSTPLVCRSSSAMEDGVAAAFPGVFASVLDITSPAELAGAIAACWRSAFSPAAVGYLLRMGAEPLDFSLALLLQRQVGAEWYGVYVSVDPVTGAREPVADLTDERPDALVGGGRAKLQARRRAGGWSGVDEALAASLESVRRAAAALGEHLGAEVDLEFALPAAGAEAVVLQCRPLTHVGAPAAGARVNPLAMRGRPWAAGRAAGVAGEPGGIAVVDHLTPADYGIVLSHAGVVMEQDASPLSHVAVLCRELGVPFVCGVAGARERLRGRRVVVDGGTGTVALTDDGAGGGAGPAPAPAPAEPVMSAVELLLRVLAEGRPGHPPAAVAERVLAGYARALGGDDVRIVAQPLDPAELAALDRLGAQLFGPDFSAAAFLALLAGR